MTTMLPLPSLIFLAIIYTSASVSVSVCNHTCGPRTVPYPFGFSAGCPIRLTCGEGVQIDKFTVRNITSNSLLVDVSPSCSRPITPTIQSFTGSNYAMTWKNVLFLRNCTAAAASGCVISTEILSDRFDLTSCGPAGDNITCLSTGNDTSFLNTTEVSKFDCSFLFTSIGYESGEMAFGTVELGWWVNGDCRCSPEAKCTNVSSPGGGRGFRCSCAEGYDGDGFADGGGCRKATGQKCVASKYMSGSCGRSRRGLLIGGGILAGASVTAILALVCFLVRRRSSRNGKDRKGARRLLSEASCTIPLYTYKDMERATNGFSDEQRLGTGAYGTVYAGKLNDDKLVAVKRIMHRDTDGIDQVMNEIKLLSSVSHPNLVRLLGCCIDRGEQLLVYEFMPHGTLSQHLQRERGPGLPWTIRLTVATETAKAIAFLHSSIHPPIYHRDIKSSNILLDHNFSSKLADFGLSRIGIGVTETSHISTAPQGTPGYLDPQYHQNFHLSDKSDVYSFGVVLVEIITALKVVDFNREQSEINLAALAIDKIGKGRVDDIIDPFLEPYRDAWTLSSINKVAELAFRCLAFHRDMRPSMMEVADELELVRLSGWAPPDDVFMSPASSLCSVASNGSRNAVKTKKWVTVVVDQNVDSPVSVQDPWISQESSPSSNSLLGNKSVLC